MSETLRQKQSRFALMVSKLIAKAYEMGYEVTIGDAYRDPRSHGALGTTIAYGHPSSAHKMRLAIDLNLFKDGVFLPNTEDHKALGEYWESVGGAWGGRFKDGNHYSLPHGAIR